jgi:hypothetical protein
MHFVWLRRTSNEQIMPQIKSQIKETHGDSVMHLRSVQRWTHDFASGRTELDVLSRPGWSIDPENTDGIREFLENKLYISQKASSRRVNLHHNTVNRIFTGELELCKAKFKWIPHFLTESHKHERVRISSMIKVDFI